MKELLQNMLDSANWYGYATRNGKRYYERDINAIAKRLKFTLTYNCPA
jgi:hypothetical protein